MIITLTEEDEYDDYCSIIVSSHDYDWYGVRHYVDELAENYYFNNDGWELDWNSPQKFYIWSKDDGVQEPRFEGEYKVCMEINPSFSSCKIMT